MHVILAWNIMQFACSGWKRIHCREIIQSLVTLGYRNFKQIQFDTEIIVHFYPWISVSKLGILLGLCWYASLSNYYWQTISIKQKLFEIYQDWHSRNNIISIGVRRIFVYGVFEVFVNYIYSLMVLEIVFCVTNWHLLKNSKPFLDGK